MATNDTQGETAESKKHKISALRMSALLRGRIEQERSGK